jgi:hypothetical protein
LILKVSGNPSSVGDNNHFSVGSVGTHRFMRVPDIVKLEPAADEQTKHMALGQSPKWEI